jgi:predicted lipoprotein with Yx(FWY)xxD motif
MRFIALGMALAAVLLIAACGGGGGTSSSAGAPATGSDTISMKQLAGVGQVLVNRSGKAVYTSNQETKGMIVCDGACTAFWKPVSAPGGKPTAAAGSGKLGVIKRPDGTSQVTANGKPLYTFTEDSPGKATGDGFTDDFQGHHFIWHVVRSGGKTTRGGSSKSSQGSGPSGTYGY